MKRPFPASNYEFRPIVLSMNEIVRLKLLLIGVIDTDLVDDYYQETASRILDRLDRTDASGVSVPFPDEEE